MSRGSLRVAGLLFSETRREAPCQQSFSTSRNVAVPQEWSQSIAHSGQLCSKNMDAKFAKFAEYAERAPGGLGHVCSVLLCSCLLHFAGSGCAVVPARFFTRKIRPEQKGCFGVAFLKEMFTLIEFIAKLAVENA